DLLERIAVLGREALQLLLMLAVASLRVGVPARELVLDAGDPGVPALLERLGLRAQLVVSRRLPGAQRLALGFELRLGVAARLGHFALEVRPLVAQALLLGVDLRADDSVGRLAQDGGAEGSARGVDRDHPVLPDARADRIASWLQALGGVVHEVARESRVGDVASEPDGAAHRRADGRARR